MRRIIYQALAYAVPVVIGLGPTVAATRVATYQAPPKKVIQEPQAFTPVQVAPPTGGDATLGFASDSGQVINKTVIYEDRTSFADYSTPAETITADKWYAPLATPVRRKLLTDPQEYAQSPPKPEANDAIGWHRALELPTRRKFVVAEEGSFFAAPPKPEARDAIGWYQDLERPTRRKFTFNGDYGYTAFLPYTNDARWYTPLNTPVRRKTAPYTDYSFVYNPVAPATPGDATLAFATTSGQVFNRTIVYEPDAYAAYTPAPEVITVDKWYRDLATPVRRKVVGDRAALTFVAAAPGNGVAQNWFFPLEIPTRARTLREWPFAAIPVYFVPPAPGAGFEYNWWSQLDEPIRPRKSIRTSQQLSLTVPSQLITTTLEYAWYQPLPTPTRLKLSFGQYPAIAQGNVNPVVPTAWYPLDAPLRIKHRHSYLAEAPFAYQQPVVEEVTIDKWWRELDRPIYTKRIDRPALTQSNVFPVVPYAWQQLHTPLRLKGRIDYPAMAQGNINPVVPYAWHQLHTPHRLKGRIDYPAHTRALFPANFPGTGVGTNQPWPALSEPVRYSPRLRPGQQQFLSYYPLLLTGTLDPACRILTPDAMYVTLAGDADVAVVPEAQPVVATDDADETVTPENQDNIVTVKC